ncbi:HU family DNA-binding protein [Prevotellamassilia timonensis]|uniref:HU family DNA-binding protein n=1 Tax=Prevotellamassilia timonensis TaxID=1852370 RepID=UPI001F40A037|nr:HU family DNA-binding protein [Prevotellamassilia timonensis]MCF2635272.1 HU family DNA-binding protein [Prevotellamassilia timonensis]
MKQKLLLSDFAQWLSEKEGITKKEAQTFLRTLFQIVEQGLTDDQFVKIKGLGTFKLVTVNERESVNINTGERFQIGEHNKIAFIPDASMKEIINRPFAHFESVDLSDETDTAELDAVDEAVKQEFPPISEEETSTAEESIPTTVEVITESSHPTSLPEKQKDVTEEVSEESNLTEEIPTEFATITEGLEEKKAEEKAETETLAQAEETEALAQAEETEALAQAEETETLAQAEAVAITAKETASESQTPEEALTPEETPIQVVSTSEKTDAMGTDAEISVSQPTTLTVSGAAVEEEEDTRRPWLRRTLMALFVLLLCTASYFAGYYRLLCPPCSSTAPTAPAAKVQPDSLQAKKPQAAKKDSAAVSAASQTASKPLNEVKDSVKQPQKQEEVVTRTHTIRVGDNLSRIARKYYGDDHYVDFIIRQNNLKNADNIHVGKVLVLPPLETEKDN